MNKAEFFKICDSCDRSLAHQLYLSSRRSHRELDNVIELSGSTWCKGGLTGYEIYRPEPGRQGVGPHPYATANAKIAKALPKFRRWLEEWMVSRNVPAKLTAAEEIQEAREYSRMMFGEEEED